MDKRWIYIIIIAIIGIACLYLIVENTPELGSANVYIGKFTITLPNSFNIEKDGPGFNHLINRNTNEKIWVYDLGEGNLVKENLTYKLDKLGENDNITILEKTSIKLKNGTFPAIYYEKLPNNKISYVTFIQKYNHTFSIESKDYPDNDTLKSDLEFVIDTLKPDLKQK